MVANSVSEKTYAECVKAVFGKRKKMAWGGRRIPPREAINLILSVTGRRRGKYGPEDLAVVWAIETNFYKRSRNKANLRGGKVVSVDIGPAQISYPTWLGLGISATLRKRVLGTKLEGGHTFNGDPKANLKFAWRYILPKLGGPVGYNPGSKRRASAVRVLKPDS